MEMDMQEPGEMRCCGWKEHQPAGTEGNLNKISGLHEPANRIIISYRGISYAC